MSTPPPPQSNAKSIPDENDWLMLAYELTHKNRESQYGHASVNVLRIAADWTLYMRQRGKLAEGATVSPIDVCWLMVGMKRARSVHHFNPDNPIDGMGYLELISRMTENAQSITAMFGTPIGPRVEDAVKYFDEMSLEEMLKYIETVMSMGGNPNEIQK